MKLLLPMSGVISDSGDICQPTLNLLDTTFYPNGVPQTASSTDLITTLQMLSIQVVWNDRATLGQGGFGTVVLQGP